MAALDPTQQFALTALAIVMILLSGWAIGNVLFDRDVRS